MLAGVASAPSASGRGGTGQCQNAVAAAVHRVIPGRVNYRPRAPLSTHVLADVKNAETILLGMGSSGSVTILTSASSAQSVDDRLVALEAGRSSSTALGAVKLSGLMRGALG